MRSGGHIALILFAVTLIYLPIAGHQLITDDFTRISANSQFDGDYLRSLLLGQTLQGGFYRPVKHFTFGLTYRLFGFNPYAYGLFNFVLLAVTCVVLFYIISRLTGDRGFASLMVIAWLANAEVVSRTIEWAVGRTSGLQMLFASCAMLMTIKANQSGRHRYVVASVIFFALALFSKECAVVVGPLLLATAIYCALTARRPRVKDIGAQLFGLLTVYIAYFVLRCNAGAVTPFSAYGGLYQWHLSPFSLLRNLGSYAAGSLRFSIVFPALVFLLAPKAYNLRPNIVCRMKWAGLFLALFVFTLTPTLPLRHVIFDHYLYLPSIFLVSAMASIAGYSPKTPQFGLSRNRFYLIAFLLILVAVRIAWARGRDTYYAYGHTLAWASKIEETIGPRREALVCVECGFNPDELGDDYEDLMRLQEVFNTKGLDIKVAFKEECVDKDYLVFRLETKNSKYRWGDLVYAQSKKDGPAATTRGLPAAAEPPPSP